MFLMGKGSSFFRQPKRCPFLCSLIDCMWWLLFYGFRDSTKKWKEKTKANIGNNTNRTITLSSRKSPGRNKINNMST